MTSAQTLTAFAGLIDARDWDGLAELLSPDFTAHFVHTGETFDRDGFVTLNRDYPIVVRFEVEDLVATGDRAVLRSRVSSETETWFVASFATITEGLIAELVEVWADVSPTVRGES